jgi:hypothetical protein
MKIIAEVALSELPSIVNKSGPWSIWRLIMIFICVKQIVKSHQ